LYGIIKDCQIFFSLGATLCRVFVAAEFTSLNHTSTTVKASAVSSAERSLSTRHIAVRRVEDLPLAGRTLQGQGSIKNTATVKYEADGKKIFIVVESKKISIAGLQQPGQGQDKT
jgi:hypothetical protein